MQIVIEIPDEDYNRIKDMPDAFNSLTSRAYKAIKNGKELNKYLMDKQKENFILACEQARIRHDVRGL